MKPDAHFERLAISRFEEIKSLRQQVQELKDEVGIMHLNLAATENERDDQVIALANAHNRLVASQQRIAELEAVIQSHGIPVKTYAGGEAHYCTKEEA